MTLISVSNNALSDISTLPASIPTGSLTLIKSITASASANISFVHGTDGVVLDGTYLSYVFKFIDIHPATNAVKFTFQTSTDSGSNYGITTTNTYFNSYHNESDTGAALGYETVADLAQSTGEIELVRENKLSSDNDHCATGYLQLFNPSSTTFVKHYIARTQSNHEADYSMDSYIAGYFNTTNAINAVRFQMSSGNIDDGIIKLYGVK